MTYVMGLTLADQPFFAHGHKLLRIEDWSLVARVDTLKVLPSDTQDQINQAKTACLEAYGKQPLEILTSWIDLRLAQNVKVADIFASEFWWQCTCGHVHSFVYDPQTIQGINICNKCQARNILNADYSYRYQPSPSQEPNPWI